MKKIDNTIWWPKNGAAETINMQLIEDKYCFGKLWLYLLKLCLNVCLSKDPKKSAHSCIITNSAETTQMSIKERMNKEGMIYSCNGILGNNEMNAPQLQTKA